MPSRTSSRPAPSKTLTENTRRFAAIYGESRPHHDRTLAGLAASAKQGGVDISLLLPIATSAKPSHSINDFAAAADKLPGLRSFGSVHPLSPCLGGGLERLRELGLRGIKLHPEYQGCYVDAPETVAVVRAAGELGLWVVFHAGADVGMEPRSTALPAGRPVCGTRRLIPGSFSPIWAGIECGKRPCTP